MKRLVFVALAVLAVPGADPDDVRIGHGRVTHDLEIASQHRVVPVGLERLDGEDRRCIDVVPEELAHAAYENRQVALDETGLSQAIQDARRAQRALSIDRRPIDRGPDVAIVECSQRVQPLLLHRDENRHLVDAQSVAGIAHPMASIRTLSRP